MEIASLAPERDGEGDSKIIGEIIKVMEAHRSVEEYICNQGG